MRQEGGGVPGQQLAAIKGIDEALIRIPIVPIAVHEVSGHVDAADVQACPPPHSRMYDGQADGDALASCQNMLQQRVLRAVVSIAVSLHMAESCPSHRSRQISDHLFVVFSMCCSSSRWATRSGHEPLPGKQA